MNKFLTAIAAMVLTVSVHAETLVYNDLVAYDGDTVVSTYKPIPGLSAIRFRLIGIDTPELRTGKCEKEKADAIRARDFLNAEIKGKPTTVEVVAWDKYGGRVLARLHNAQGEDLANKLIAAGYARAYSGGFKASWCK